MVTCPFCHSSKNQYQWHTIDIYQNKWDLYRCQSCRFYFLHPFPTDEQLARAYATDYYGAGKNKFNFPFVEKVLDYFRSSRARMLKKILNHKKQSKILDIGCGNGRFLNYLHGLGFKQLYGIELPGNSADRAKKYEHLHIHIGKIEDAMYDHDSFDAITMFHVLEHTKNPIQIIEKVQSWLRSQGVFIVSFPNIASHQAQKYKGYWLHLDPPRHLNFIQPDDFVAFMQQYGFELYNICYFSPEQNPFGYVQSQMNKKAPKREILFESFKGNKDYLSDVSKKILWYQRFYFFIAMPYYFLVDMFEAWQKKSGTVLFVFKKK
ncbi:MAG: class I SAM-dependent methyltransferase [Bacteroidales bacterium]|nr:class I SAM-dependent methyltransferase [Bacteroidales bacterium]